MQHCKEVPFYIYCALYRVAKKIASDKNYTKISLGHILVPLSPPRSHVDTVHTNNSQNDIAK